MILKHVVDLAESVEMEVLYLEDEKEGISYLFSGAPIEQKRTSSDVLELFVTLLRHIQDTYLTIRQYLVIFEPITLYVFRGYLPNSVCVQDPICFNNCGC